jgi:hypothetical protein
MENVNIWAVVVAAIASMVIGSIWYGPLFGKMFIRLMGLDQKSPEEQAAMKKGMIWLYVIQFIGSIIMFCILGWVLAEMGDNYAGTSGALHITLLVWLGFIVTTHLGNAIWGGKIKLFWLALGNSLITMVVGALILVMWK